MTDVRKCDGPGCEIEAELDAPVIYANRPNADHFIVVDGARGRRFHFHQERCMLNWAREETKG